MITVKVTLDNGDNFTTRINATEQESRKYYMGKVFNVGTVDDNLQKCIDVEVID